jgi:hypothetical protein
MRPVDSNAACVDCGGGLALGLGVCGGAIDNAASVRLIIEDACG